MHLDYAGPIEAEQLGLFAEPLPIPGKCPICKHEAIYGGVDLHQMSGPDPNAQKPEQ